MLPGMKQEILKLLAEVAAETGLSEVTLCRYAGHPRARERIEAETASLKTATTLRDYLHSARATFRATGKVPRLEPREAAE